MYNSARHGKSFESKKPDWYTEYNIGYVILDYEDPSKII